jgi:hypothetical protein
MIKGLSESSPAFIDAEFVRGLHEPLRLLGVVAQFQSGPRAAHFDRTRPFQIPLGALLPIRLANLIAGAKNIGRTHLTNGCYRLHPVEWNIGESAGALAAYALHHGMTPAEVRSSALRAFQRSLLDEGVPLAWIVDVGVDHAEFPAVQALFMTGRLDIGLRFEPDAPLDENTWHAWGGSGPPPPTRADGARQLLG